MLQDAGGHPLLLQVKQAGPSVLVEHGRQDVPPGVASLISRSGEGARVVALQRILQGVSDPFLGHFRGDQGDYYLRQFRDMKIGLDNVMSCRNSPPVARRSIAPAMSSRAMRLETSCSNGKRPARHRSM